MSVALESVTEEPPAEAAVAPEESAANPQEPAEVAPEPADESLRVTESPPGPEPELVTAESVPEPKKRGRPRKEEPATPKAPVRMKAAPKPPAPKPCAKRAATTPVAPPPEESDEDEPFSRADLETEILEFLVQRKTQQQDRRRQLWAQLAGL